MKTPLREMCHQKNSTKKSRKESCICVILLSGECVISSVLSHHNKNLKQWTSVTVLRQASITALGQTSVTALRRTSITALGWTSVTAQLYLKNKGKYILKAWGHANPKDMKRRGRERERAKETPSPLAPLFICFFLLPLSLTCITWASQVGCLFYLRSSLWSSDLPLFYFCGLFPSSLSGLLFSILTT